MPYAAVYYPSSTRPYTFYTDKTDITNGQKVLVKDKNGFSLVTFTGYVNKPSFKCQIVVATQMEMEEKAEQVRVEMLEESGEVEVSDE